MTEVNKSPEQINQIFARHLKQAQQEADSGKARAARGELESALKEADESEVGPRGRIDLGSIQTDFCGAWKFVEGKLSSFTWVPYVGKYLTIAVALMRTADELAVNQICAASGGGTTAPAGGGGAGTPGIQRPGG